MQTISFAEDMNPKYRSTMEDACTVVDGFGGDASTGYFSVYDGHGGRNVAEYLRLHLHVNIEKELRSKGDRSVEECMKAAFLITDAECSTTGEQASGSTAAVCIVRKSGLKRYVYAANCGDARSVLCHAGVAVRLSKDHKATDAVEKARIEAAGGFVIRKRVMGVLAVARSFGDFVLKKYVTSEPYTSTTKLDAMVCGTECTLLFTGYHISVLYVSTPSSLVHCMLVPQALHRQVSSFLPSHALTPCPYDACGNLPCACLKPLWCASCRRPSLHHCRPGVSSSLCLCSPSS